MGEQKNMVIGIAAFAGLIFTLAMLTINLHFIVPGLNI